ncbi:hypothetical protein AG74_161 [Vibrio phage AG74]|uniref:Uncharacterized protein n=2 Tax=Thalassavirus TaxID=2948922 RepID=A0A4Y6E8M6_9CAUD|nr:hypothetical protein KNU58_gp132 [Vibrio phage Brizo]YP_010108183.1 hypothetical protein KNV06_gp146 [Vibrio phage AG74]QDF14551.1 hypothetical protein BRIZO_154 [Vibrio phage Brizo]QKN84997.1 hypothetical protein AG74_161 [Vibrio phage AG74]WBF69510.1 hypothetical protein IW18_161 [Vibrio phage IW18]
MKGSMKLKFDLGWVFSVTLAVGVVMFGAARISLAMEAQERLATSCQLFEESLYDALEKDPGEKRGIVTARCINEYKKPTLAIALDTDKWSYQEIYAKAVRTLKM